MEQLDAVSIILVALGSVLVYGSVPILKLLNKYSEKKMVILKIIGLLLAAIGFFRILDII